MTPDITAGVDAFYVGLWLATGVLLLVAIAFGLTTIRLRLQNDRTARRWAALEQVWEPVVLDVLTGVVEPEQLQSQVGEAERDFFLAFLLRYARRLRGPEQDQVHALAQPHLPPLVDRVRHGSAEARALAVGTLAEVGMPDYAPSLVEALDDPSPLVAMIAARSLLTPELTEFLPEVLARLGRFELWSRGFLAGMLAAAGPAAAPPLRDMLSDSDCDPALRAVAAEALRRLRDLPSADIAAEVASASPHPEVAAECLRLLRSLGHAAHLPVVRRSVDSENDVVRAAAMAALGELGSVSERPLLEAGLSDESTWVALHAARGLAAIGRQDLLEQTASGGGPGSAVALQVLGE